MSKEEFNRGSCASDSQKSVSSSQQQSARRGRSWLWFVPAVVLAVIVLGGGAIYWSLFLRVYNLEVCRSAMRPIEADKQVREALGEPIRTIKWPSRANIPSARVEQRETDVRWHIEGPKGRAEAHLFSRLMMGKWETVTLDVTLANGKTIAVHEAGDTAAEAPVFAGPKPGTEKKAKANAPPPEINLMLPPDANIPAK